MKACPVCGRLYPGDAGFCPVDGTQLTSASLVPVAQQDDDPRVGQLLCERYQVRRVVADGGMGRVYEALDMHQRRNVAVKVLHGDVAQDPVQVERFRREFEVSQQLPHEHIVEVFDFRPTRDGSFALVMEFLYGEELRATLKREGVLPPWRLVRMLSQVAIGLDGAHARRLVHRDLKPDNLFLCQTTEGDIVKVLDFGSVKDKSQSAKKLTVMGTTIGSPFYMAPEQAKGEESLDQRADVWALAAIAYECVTGTVPFQGINGPSILLQILTAEPVPPSQAGKAQKYPVPPTLDRALGTAFKKLPALRTPSVGALADEVGRAYGLAGDHRQWAATPEAALGEQIQARLPSMMAMVEPARPADAADSFFGESDALGGFSAPPSHSPAGGGYPAPHSLAPVTPPPGGPAVQGGYEAPLQVAGVPSRPPWLLLGAVGGVLVLLVIAVVVLLLLR